MSEKRIVEIEESQIKEMQRFDLIFRSINLALLDMGIKDLNFKRLDDKDGKVRIEIEKDDYEDKWTEIDRENTANYV
jgi:hypothetical protein